MTLLATIGLNYYMFRYQMTYGLFPVQDTGLIIGSIQGDQSISFQAMREKLEQLQTIVQEDPAVASVVGFTGGRQTNSGFVYISLKPYAERKVTADEVVNAAARQTGGGRRRASLHGRGVGPAAGGRQSNATYQYTLLSDDTTELYEWAPKLTAALMNSDILKDVNSDQQQGGLETDITIDRDTAMRLGLTLNAIDNTLYDAFGQRQVSTIYNAHEPVSCRDGGRAALLAGPKHARPALCLDLGREPDRHPADGHLGGPVRLRGPEHRARRRRSRRIRRAISRPTRSRRAGARAPRPARRFRPRSKPWSRFRLSRKFSPGHTPLSVNHQGLFAASTISFNLAPGRALSEAKTEIDNAIERIGMPSTVRGAFAGTAATFQQSQSSLPLLFGAAMVTIYIVLGILYESLIHPLTILSTLFSASVGAALALWLFATQFTIIAAIGVLLLIGIVKKNAIMMVDFALEAERHGLDTREAIEQACLIAFPADHDDDLRGDLRRAAARFRDRRGRGIAPSARHHHRRRADRQPGADALYDAGRVPLPRPVGKGRGRLWRRYYLRVGPAPLAAAE